jgi:hypothetical protein
MERQFQGVDRSLNEITTFHPRTEPSIFGWLESNSVTACDASPLRFLPVHARFATYMLYYMCPKRRYRHESDFWADGPKRRTLEQPLSSNPSLTVPIQGTGMRLGGGALSGCKIIDRKQ